MVHTCIIFLFETTGSQESSESIGIGEGFAAL